MRLFWFAREVQIPGAEVKEMRCIFKPFATPKLGFPGQIRRTVNWHHFAVSTPLTGHEPALRSLPRDVSPIHRQNHLSYGSEPKAIAGWNRAHVFAKCFSTLAVTQSRMTFSRINFDRQTLESETGHPPVAVNGPNRYSARAGHRQMKGSAR